MTIAVHPLNADKRGLLPHRGGSDGREQYGCDELDA